MIITTLPKLKTTLEYIACLNSATSSTWHLNGVPLIVGKPDEVRTSQYPDIKYILSLENEKHEVCTLVLERWGGRAFMDLNLYTIAPLINSIIEVSKMYQIRRYGDVYLNFRTLGLYITIGSFTVCYINDCHRIPQIVSGYIEFYDHPGLESISEVDYCFDDPENEEGFDSQEYVRITNLKLLS